MAKQKQTVLEYLKNTKVSIATAALTIFTFGLLLLQAMPSVDVEGSSVLQANVFAVLDTINN
jgi:hypothetical protein